MSEHQPFNLLFNISKVQNNIMNKRHLTLFLIVLFTIGYSLNGCGRKKFSLDELTQQAIIAEKSGDQNHAIKLFKKAISLFSYLKFYKNAAYNEDGDKIFFYELPDKLRSLILSISSTKLPIEVKKELYTDSLLILKKLNHISRHRGSLDSKDQKFLEYTKLQYKNSPEHQKTSFRKTWQYFLLNLCNDLVGRLPEAERPLFISSYANELKGFVGHYKEFDFGYIDRFINNPISKNDKLSFLIQVSKNSKETLYLVDVYNRIKLIEVDEEAVNNILDEILSFEKFPERFITAIAKENISTDLKTKMIIMSINDCEIKFTRNNYPLDGSKSPFEINYPFHILNILSNNQFEKSEISNIFNSMLGVTKFKKELNNYLVEIPLETRRLIMFFIKKNHELFQMKKKLYDPFDGYSPTKIIEGKPNRKDKVLVYNIDHYFSQWGDNIQFSYHTKLPENIRAKDYSDLSILALVQSVEPTKIGHYIGIDDLFSKTKIDAFKKNVLVTFIDLKKSVILKQKIISGPIPPQQTKVPKKYATSMGGGLAGNSPLNEVTDYIKSVFNEVELN
jgi:hypothetical protein